MLLEYISLSIALIKRKCSKVLTPTKMKFLAVVIILLVAGLSEGFPFFSVPGNTSLTNVFINLEDDLEMIITDVGEILREIL